MPWHMAANSRFVIPNYFVAYMLPCRYIKYSVHVINEVVNRYNKTQAVSARRHDGTKIALI